MAIAIRRPNQLCPASCCSNRRKARLHSLSGIVADKLPPPLLLLPLLPLLRLETSWDAASGFPLH